jgi:uncharacterized protein with HEPN domain
MREEARLIVAFVAGLNFERFMQSEVMMRAAAMTIANIGELCGALTDEAKQLNKDVPWAAIRKTRNVIFHDYESVDFSIL